MVWPSLGGIILSWQKLPSQSEVMASIHNFILNLDKDDSTNIQITDSRAIKAARFEDITYDNEIVAILVREAGLKTSACHQLSLLKFDFSAFIYY